MQLSDREKAILKLLLRAQPTQKEIAAHIKAKEGDVTRSLLKLKTAGLISLGGKGKPVKLAVLAAIEAFVEAFA